MSSKLWIMYIGPFIALLATSATGILNNPVVIFVENGLTYGELFIIIYIFVLIVGMITDKFQIEMENKDKLVKHYEDDIKNKTVGLLDHYKRLNRFQLTEVLHDVMKAFTEKHAYVISSQLYKFSVQHTIENKIDSTVIKLNYIQGFIDEREEQNVILQSYYFIPMDLYSNYFEAMFYINKNKTYMQEFVLNIIEQLNGEIKDVKDVSDLHGTKYAFILLGMVALGLDESVMVLKNVELDRTVRNKVKTGLMRGILNQTKFYTFNYIATKEGVESDKEGRIYLTKKIKIRGESHVFLLTISKFVNESDNPATNIVGIGEEFEKLIIDSIPGSEYN